jgi:uncharacterized protein (TIGR02452 family)
VPVFRNDDGALLDQPSYPSMLTSAAPNAGAVRRQQHRPAASLASLVRDRATRVLDIAAAYGHRELVHDLNGDHPDQALEGHRSRHSLSQGAPREGVPNQR